LNPVGVTRAKLQKTPSTQCWAFLYIGLSESSLSSRPIYGNAQGAFGARAFSLPLCRDPVSGCGARSAANPERIVSLPGGQILPLLNFRGNLLKKLGVIIIMF